MAQKKNETLSAADNAFLAGLTYDDYLSSVYSYDDATIRAINAVTAAESMKDKYEQLSDEIGALETSDGENRREYARIHSEEVARQREIWEKNKARFDFKISNRIAVAESTAKNDIRCKKDEYEDALKTAREQADSVAEHLRKLDKDYNELEQARKKFEDFSGKSFPPVDEEALHTLERAREKRLLTKFQRDMLKENVRDICSDRLTGFDDLISEETAFAKSDFYKAVHGGKVTEREIGELARVTAVIIGVLLVIAAAAAGLTQPNPARTVIFTTLNALGFGGVFASCLHVAREKFEKLRNLPIPERAQIIMIFTVGVIAGVLAGLFVSSPSVGVVPLIYTVLCAVVCGLLCHRVMTAKILRGYLSRLGFLKDRARKHLFESAETAENGTHNYRIYLYLEHDAVLMYLSMLYKDNEVKMLGEKIEFNRKDKKYFEEQLAEHKRRVKDLESNGGDIGAYEKQRMMQLAEELRLIEEERPAQPDFDELASRSAADKLKPLDDEHDSLLKQIAEKRAEFEPIEKEYLEKTAEAERLKADRRRIAEALRAWTKTPLPSSTGYRLIDSLCIESKSRLTVINHGLKPYVLRYTAKNRNADAAELLKSGIYKYIKGLCKINPRRLLQVNIFDYVSNTNILVSAPMFKKIAGRGVIEGIYSMKDFEIRLFSNNEGYKTFKELFRVQCGKMSAYIRDNRDRIPDGETCDIVLANKLHGGDSDLFMYQICMFIVPREDEGAMFRPPKGILELIDKGSSLKYGILPVFFVDEESIAPEWIPYIQKYCSDTHIFAF